MYADIGPSSFQKRPHIILGPDDDDHVEYAQLNQTLLTVKEEETKQKMETSFIGNYKRTWLSIHSILTCKL